ncbi:MAG TPA: PAS domain-containing sensor histidine kinase [Gemmatimonadaceae bacterium]|nr:PAS domain-containing sensor histidine kinase [Gemmatimonadaceae bacterium]
MHRPRPGFPEDVAFQYLVVNSPRESRELREGGALPPAHRAPVADPHALLDAVPAPVAVIDTAWSVVYANRAWAQLADTAPRGELRLAAPWLDSAPAAEVLRQTMADGVARTALVEQGPGAAYELHLAPFGGGVVATLAERLRPADVDERHQENEALRELAHRMAAVPDADALLRTVCEAAMAQTAAEGAIVVQLDGPTDGVVVAACGPAERRRGDRLPFARSLSERVIRERVTLAVRDQSAEYADGPTPLRDVVAGPVLLTPLIARDQTLGVLAVGRAPGAAPFGARDERRVRAIADHAADVLLKAKLLDEAQAASLAKSTFLATMSHELRTPITALTGYGELLTDEILGPLNAEQTDIVERMCSVTHHLSGIIEELLTYSSLEAGREKVRPADTDVAEVMLAVQTVIEPIARQKGLRYRHALAGGPLIVRTDADKVRQILVNLAGNAVKFTEAGEVSVTAERGPEAIRFAVCDTGIGIARDDQQRLFQPFAQLDATLTRRHGGTGLGLYISQRLARLLGGRIDVESAPARGSTFAFVLPL